MCAANDVDNNFDFDRIVEESLVEQVRYHAAIHSTNNDALEICQDNEVRAPLLVVTSQQTAGRGRGSNHWWSAAGALTFSLVIRPADFGLTEQQWPKASLTTGLSICLALDELAPNEDVTLKWPNDVLVNRRKICGVLVEVGGARPSPALVIGIGINVNNSLKCGPEELADSATSLVDATGSYFELNDVLISVLRHLERQITRLRNDDPMLPSEWQRRCALRGRSIDVATGHRSRTGRCQGIDEDGALVLLTEAGLERFFGGVVARIR